MGTHERERERCVPSRRGALGRGVPSPARPGGLAAEGS